MKLISDVRRICLSHLFYSQDGNAVTCSSQKKKWQKKKKKKKYNTGYSLVVTHPTTNPPI
jgi:hypothetical protein